MKPAAFLFAALVLSLAAGPAPAQSLASAPVPASPKAGREEASGFRVPPGAIPAARVHLGAPDGLEIASARRANAAGPKRLQVGVGRESHTHPSAQSRKLEWWPAPDGVAAHWEIGSTGALGLRAELEAVSLPPEVEIRFRAEGDAAVSYGPAGARDFDAHGRYWSPVLRGERAFIEIFVPGGTATGTLDIAISALSHLFADPADAGFDAQAKAFGDADGRCQHDLVCRAAGDPALANVGKAVARMIFSDGAGGSSFACSGTLLRSSDNSGVPYFYTAAHCIDTNSAANTLTTHWFYQRAQCDTGGEPAYTQVAGGAQLLYASTASDATLLRLNNPAPAGAWFAGWDAATVGAATPITGVHHPRADVKKVSLGSVLGMASPGAAYGSMIVTRWSYGVTEPGSSGSGLFTAVGSPATDYRLRGGLWGGASSCDRPTDQDFYSRFDQAYAAIAKYIDPPPGDVLLTVSRSGSGAGTVTSAPNGIACGATCAASFAPGTLVTLTASAAAGSTFSGWGGACTGSGTCSVALSAAAFVTASFTAASSPPPPLGVSAGSIDFGGQSMMTTSPERQVILANNGSAGMTFSVVMSPSYFPITHDCVGTIPSGSSCTVRVRFAPAAQGTHFGSLVVQSSAGAQSIALSGMGERSLVVHYYQSILRRAPDSSGKTFWEAEAARVSRLGANVNEAWYAMAASFFASGEYAALGRDDAGYVADLYATFFNRAPDDAGLGFWTAQLGSGLPREVALVGFMMSPEFAAFTRAIFGNPAVRAEIDTVGDFYRGLLARLPDDAGFAHWVRQFRLAQCQGAGAVNAEALAISAAFASGGEYTARNRTHAQYVGDLYNAFLRRGGDLPGVQFWIAQLESGAKSRDEVRLAFAASPEFSARVAAVVAQGCLNP